MEDEKTAPVTGHGPGCFLCTTAMPILERCMEELWPEKARDHFRASRVEFLKGLRSLLDARIAQLSREAAHRGTRVTVE